MFSGCDWHVPGRLLGHHSDSMGMCSGITPDVIAMHWDVMEMSAGCDWDVICVSAGCDWYVCVTRLECYWDATGMRWGYYWDVMVMLQ